MSQNAPSKAVLDEIRVAARARTAQSSLRLVAQEIGISHTTLNNFVRGAHPHPRILSRILEWYDQGADDRLAAALDVLLGGLPESARVEADKAVLAAALEQHRRDVEAWPGWVRFQLASTVPRRPGLTADQTQAVSIRWGSFLGAGT